MAKKLKFRPVITRIKLNPEQAVLVCSCFSAGGQYLATTTARIRTGTSWHCEPNGRIQYLPRTTGGCNGTVMSSAARSISSS